MISWEMLWPVGVLILGLALAYGAWRYHSRNKANDRVTERATHELYAHPDTYDENTRRQLKDQLKPD